MAATTTTTYYLLIVLSLFLVQTWASDMSLISYDETHNHHDVLRTHDEVMSMYGAWLVEHGKTYNALVRRRGGSRSSRATDEQNALSDRSYELGLTRFADLTNEEYRKTFLGERLTGAKSDRYEPKVNVMALLSDLGAEVVIPVCAVIGIVFSLVQWYLVSQVKLTPVAASNSNSGKNGYAEYLIEDGGNDQGVVVKCAEIQNATSEVRGASFMRTYELGKYLLKTSKSLTNV